MDSKSKKIKRKIASGPGIPSKEGESDELRRIRLEKQYLGDPFISEGSVFCFPLLDLMYGPIGGNDYKIIALYVYSKNGALYGAISGDEDHLFFMNKKKLMMDLGKVGNKKINENSIKSVNNFVYFSVTDSENNTTILKHDADTDHIDHYSLNYFGPIEETNAVIEGESFIESAFNNWDKNIYYLSKTRKVFKLNIDKENLNVIVELEKESSKAFCCDDNGNIFGVLHGGEILRFNISERKFYKTGKLVPSQKGREYLAGARKMIFREGVIYGCTSQDNYLFKYDICRNEIFNFGRPDENYDLRSFIVKDDGSIFGATSTVNRGLGNLFKYNKNGFKDLGNIVGYRPKNGFCHEPSVMVLGNDGEIFIGDNDNRSNLYIYFPKF